MNSWKGVWATTPAESDDGKTVIVTGRRDVGSFRNNPRYSIRVNIGWPYSGDATGMPQGETSTLMEEVTERLADAFDRDPVAVMTGIYTGDNRRDLVFYTISTHILGRKLNEALADLPQLPLEISCENDPDWLEYDEMSSMLPDDAD